jgi:hypothetical protein
MYARRDFPLSSVLKIVAEGWIQTGKRKRQTRGGKIISKHILRSAKRRFYLLRIANIPHWSQALAIRESDPLFIPLSLGL